MINTDDDEREHLLELKKLVVLSNVGPNTENEADEDIVDKFQPNPTVDIGGSIVYAVTNITKSLVQFEYFRTSITWTDHLESDQ